jgi:organic radical activating enzyme
MKKGWVEAVQMKLLHDRQIFDMEITTNCNKQCYICPRKSFQRKGREMSPDVFKTVCAWLPSNCDVFFAGYGEPLLHNNCLSYIYRLHKRGIGTSLLTNGKLLSPDIVKDLFSSGLDKLQISILLKYEIGSISHYVNMIDSQYHTKVRFNLLYDDTMTKPIQITNDLLKKGFEISYKLIHNRAGFLYHTDHSRDISCGTFFIVTYIDTHGNLTMCANDINGKYVMGNVTSLPFHELIEKKKTFIGNQLISPICANCTDEYRTIYLNRYGTT